MGIAAPLTLGERRPAVSLSLLVPLVVAGLAELILLRLVYRVGLFIPRDGPFMDIYRATTALGSLAFDLASVLALLVVAEMALAARRSRPVRAGVFGLLFLASLAAVLAPADARDAARAAFALSALVVVVALAASGLADRNAALDRLALGSVALAIGAGQGWALVAGTNAALGAVFEPPLVLVAVAELVAVFAALALAAAALRRGRTGLMPLTLAALVALLLAGALVAQPYLTGIVLLWGEGVSLLLPGAAYAGALAALLLAAAVEARQPDRSGRTVGVLLLLAAGVVPQTTAHALMALLGLAALAGE